MDSCLSNGDGLLLHGLMDSHLILDIHLVELVNAANSVVNQHQGTRLNAKLARLRILPHTRRQTSGITRLSTAVDGSGQELADIFEELTFCSGRVPHYAKVQITSQLQVVSRVLLNSSKELEKDAFLDVKVPLDRRS